MNRSLWFLAGAGAGVYAVVRARRVAEAFTPEGLADRLAGLSVGMHLFSQEVRAGMGEKETQLRQRLTPAPHGGPRGLDPSTGPGQGELDHRKYQDREGND